MSQPAQVVAPQPFAPQQLPPPHVSPKKTWATKLGFRIASFIFCIVLIGLAASQAASGSYYYFDTIYGVAFMVPPAVIAAIWNVAEFICILARRGRRGMHPAAIVSIDLLLWLAYIALTVVYGLSSLYDYSDYSSYYSYSNYSIPSFGIAAAIVAFGALETICHFSLFVIGCVETHIRNHAAPQVIYYAAPPGMQVLPMQPGAAYPGQPIEIPANVYYQAPVNGAYPQQQHYSWAPVPAGAVPVGAIPAGVSPHSDNAVLQKEGP